MISDRTKRFIHKLQIKLRITYSCRRCNPHIWIWCRIGKVICYILRDPSTRYTKVTSTIEKTNNKHNQNSNTGGDKLDR